MSTKMRSFMNAAGTLTSLQSQIILPMLERVKKFIQKHKYKILAGLSLLAAGYFAYEYIADESEIKLSHFMEAVRQNHIKEAIVKGRVIEFKGLGEEWFSTFIGRFPIQKIYKLMKDKGVSFSIQEAIISRQFVNVGVSAVFSMISLKAMMSEIQKPDISNSNIEPNVVKNNQKFQDFYGGDKIKTKFKEIIDFLQHPEKYEKMGARIRRGVMFHGPPGTGKTMMARALANEAGCDFIKVVASEFQEMFVGVGAKRVRELFASARACPQGCIIFVDEIDALGSRLNHLRDSHETTTTINQFLSQMDGFSPTDRIVIVAATNRIDLVDYAILRAGRFDLKIHIDLPDVEERKGIFGKLVTTKCKNYQITSEIINEVANHSEAWCGADLENLINEAIYKAIRQKSDTLRGNHVLEAMRELKAK